MPSNKGKIESLISTGGEIAGVAAAEAVGSLVGGPVGAAIGGALGKVLSDVADRILSKREKIRVRTTAAIALEKIKSHIDAGERPRGDGFFSSTESERSNAEEIFEGVLLKSKNEHEEKKVRILGNIFANVAFLPGFSAAESNHLLEIAERLTYRKMCLLTLVERKAAIPGLKLRENDYRELKGEIPHEMISILLDVCELDRLGILACRKPSSRDYETLADWADVVPDRLVLTYLGSIYYQIMGLEDIPVKDILEVAEFINR